MDNFNSIIDVLKSEWIVPIVIFIFALFQIVFDKSIFLPSLVWLAISVSIMIGMVVSTFVEKKWLWGIASSILSFLVINVIIFLVVTGAFS
jgi:hypothetical protein